MAQAYTRHKSTPLTEKEIKQRYVNIQNELKEVFEWKKEEEAKLEDKNSSPQKKAAAKRSLKKVARRIDTVNGQILYWKMRVAGESHFKSSLEMNEYWARCNEEKEKKISVEKELPNLLKGRL